MTGATELPKAAQTGTPGIVRSTAGLGGSVPERTCEQGCNGCDECADYDDDDMLECERCRGDGADPWCDYLLPCPACQGEQRPC